jgi:hypothetical protein
MFIGGAKEYDTFIKGVALLGFNPPPLGALLTGGAGDLFPRIHKAFKKKSSIPQGLPCGCSSVSFIVISFLFWFVLTKTYIEILLS